MQNYVFFELLESRAVYEGRKLVNDSCSLVVTSSTYLNCLEELKIWLLSISTARIFGLVNQRFFILLQKKKTVFIALQLYCHFIDSRGNCYISIIARALVIASTVFQSIVARNILTYRRS